MSALLYSPDFWVAVAFVILVAATAKPIWRAVTGALDKRAQAIKSQLEEAQALREEAQKTLAEYKRKQRDAMKQADEIVEHTKVEAERMRDQAQKDLEHTLKRREESAMSNIAQAEAKAIQEVRNRAVEIAIAASEKLLRENLDEARSRSLIDRSIEDISKKFH